VVGKNLMTNVRLKLEKHIFSLTGKMLMKKEEVKELN